MKRLLNKKYSVKTSEVKNKEGCWSSLKVEIFQGENKIGEYSRNYPSLYNTFYPFEWNGKDYALYSPDYQTTSLMSLPDCKLISEHNSGFCPTDFCVPDEDDFFEEEPDKDSYIANIAIVAGCIWGDDAGDWKIEAINLKDINNIKVENLFGYCQLKYNDAQLDDCITWSSWAGGRITFPLSVDFHFDKDNSKSGALGFPFESLKHYRGDGWDNYNIIKIRDVSKKEE